MVTHPVEPEADNVLVGLATIQRARGALAEHADAAQYRAVGLQAVGSGPDGDEVLHIGGPDAEYESCPAYGLIDHYFDFAPLRAGEKTRDLETTLALSTCTSAISEPAAAVVQFLVYNEFSQRFSTSRPISGQLVLPLSLIDTPQRERSIFSIQVSGTVTGRIQLAGIGSGLHAVIIEGHRSRENPADVSSDAVEAPGLAQRAEGDIIVYRPPACTGDCNLDGAVAVNEIVSGLNVLQSPATIDQCHPIDGDGNLRAEINEVLSAVGSALESCPAPPPPPTPAPTPTRVPVEPPTSIGPEITHLGLATADDRALEADEVDGEGRPVFVRPFGQGMTIIVEARPGTNRRQPGGRTYTPGQLPDLQVLVSRPLGNGDPAVCESGGRSGGVPGIPELEFSDDPEIVAAINDLGCRAHDQEVSAASSCTVSPRLPGFAGGPYAPIMASSQLQYCLPIGRAWAFPRGETIVAARVRDVQGNLSEVSEMVVRITE